MQSRAMNKSKHKGTEKKADTKRRFTEKRMVSVIRILRARTKKRRTALGQAQRREEDAKQRGSKKANITSQPSTKNRIQYARATRGQEVLSAQGPWLEAAARIALAEGVEPLPIMPPSYVALNDKQCLADIKQMYDFLQMTSWQTCVVCWRAWYCVPMNYNFRMAHGKGNETHKWFNPHNSAILGAKRKKNVNQWFIDSNSLDKSASERRSDARNFLQHNYAQAVWERIWAQLVMSEHDADRDWGRDITICKSCAPHVKDSKLKELSNIRLCDHAVDPVFTSVHEEDGQTLSTTHERWEDHYIDVDDVDACTTENPRTCILGLSIDVFAPAVALLTDHEEMVIALVHPLVQVYTIPRTGQLAYVGHICNFRQKVSKFLKSLPMPKHEFPFVMVRPRNFKNRPSTKALFKINVH